MYVNREAKMALYGKKIDPLPQIETIIGEAPKMSDREFHDSMSKVFKSQRDGHLIYSYPGTQSCFTVHTGLKFDLVDSGEAVVVSIVSTIAQGSAPGQMQYGDSLVGFDGLSLSQRYESLKWEISGSNTESGMRRVLFLLSSMLGSRFKMPARDTFDLMMKRRETGEEYKVTLPWLVSLDKTCLKEASAVIKGNLAKRYLERRGNTARIFASGSLQETMFEKRAKVEPVTGMPWVKTENSGKIYPCTSCVCRRNLNLSAVMWQKFRLDNFNLGILRISTFGEQPYFLEMLIISNQYQFSICLFQRSSP